MNCFYPECMCKKDSCGNTVCEMSAEPKCKTHPDAPHGFDRNGSHSMGRYVCECENWEPDEPDFPDPKLSMCRAYLKGRMESLRKEASAIERFLESVDD